ncbi:helix-turn-helix domain-containing protein [Nocardioides sp. MAHUQ-72]|uniref:helix-turn-helix domain-containing protein n=1 Tax=unclassified Nocardioides TaxID=2615069 RepID=UPI003619B0A3
MARTPDVLDDPTPLDSRDVDVRVRVAWLLRVSRAAGIDGTRVSVTEMAQRLKAHGIPASAPSVSGWETGRVSPGVGVLEAYEAVLGREPGTLRGAVDVIRRTYSRDRPRTAPTHVDLAGLDRVTERVLGARTTTGMDWLHFAEAAVAVSPGLPTRMLRPMLDRLVSELGRSVFTAYVTRYEALALLRCSQYATMVLDAIRRYVDEPGTQVVADCLTAVAERADAACLTLLAGYLTSDDPVRSRGAALGLQTFATVGGVPARAWSRLVEPFVSAVNEHLDDPTRQLQLSVLWGSLPAALRADIAPRLARRMAPVPTPRPWDVDRHDQELAFCAALADEVCDAADLRPQPLLARLLFEGLFDHRNTRNWTSMLLLMASPVRADLATRLAATTHDHEDAVVREACARLLMGLGHAESTRYATGLLDTGVPDLVAPALVALAHADAPVPHRTLAGLLTTPEPVDRRALYYAGMTGHRLLDVIAGDREHPLSQAARWWQGNGTIVTA